MTTAAKPSWFKMSNAANGVARIDIFGDIGGWGITFADFNRQLESMLPVDEILLNINSDGGDVFDGFAIYNALKMSGAKITTQVMGLAASMASVIAMAGDSRKMPANAVMMIHNPVGAIMGDAEELISYGEAVGQMRDAIAQTYSDASGGKLSVKDALKLMAKQTWLTAAEAADLGLATDVLAPVKIAAKFDLSRFQNAPASYGEISNKESAMTDKTKATATATETPAAPAVETPAVETPAVETPAAPDALTAERARVKEINGLCAVAKRPELAGKFIEDGLSASEVAAKLLADKAPKTDREVNARTTVDTGDTPPVIDTDAIWNKWNKAK